MVKLLNESSFKEKYGIQKFAENVYATNQDRAFRLSNLVAIVQNVYYASIYGKYIALPEIVFMESTRHKSYTVNKSLIILNFENYPDTELVYHLLHEISHVVCTKCLGHTDDWEQVLLNLVYTYYKLRD